MSPTQRSLAYLRAQGMVAEVVERWIPGANIRKDFLGVFDILAFHPTWPGVLGVQVCSRTDAAKRRTKMQESGHLSTWLACQNRAHLHSWAKQGPRGEPKRWNVKIDEVVP